jgi:hypothetical protein
MSTTSVTDDEKTYCIWNCVDLEILNRIFLYETPQYIKYHWQIFDIIEQRMSEVQKGTSRNTENENKRCKIFNKVLNMNWEYVLCLICIIGIYRLKEKFHRKTRNIICYSREYRV